MVADGVVRVEELSELRADLTFGVRPLPQWAVLAQLFNVVSEGASQPIYPSYDYSKFQLSVIYDLNRQWSLQAGGFTAARAKVPAVNSASSSG